MFGNKEGWLISLVVVGVMGWMLVKVGRVEPMGKPSGQFKNLFDPVKLPVPPDEVLPGVMTVDRDAGDQYWQAIELYQKFPTEYKRFDPKDVSKVARLGALNLLVEATSAKRASIFIDRPELLANYKFPWPELDVLASLGQYANSVGHYYAVRKNDEDLALKYLHAGFALGAKLYEERVTQAEMLEGIKLMQGASDSLLALAKLKKDTAGVAKYQRFGNETRAYYTTEIQPLYQKINSTARNDLLVNAGDVFEVAGKNPDRMWRVEAILKVGRYRYNSPRRGDQIAANRMLSDTPEKWGFADWTKDPDPAVKAAAVAAKELTLEAYRGIR